MDVSAFNDFPNIILVTMIRKSQLALKSNAMANAKILEDSHEKSDVIKDTIYSL